MYEDDDEDDQTKSAAGTRGTEPTDRTVQTMSATAAPAATPPQAQRFQMPWARGQGMAPGQGQGQPMQGGGHPGFGWGQGGMQGGQPGGIMGGQGQGGMHAMPNWQALAQQFAQRFQQNNPFLQRMGMTGQGHMPPGQAPAAPPQGQPGGTPPIWAGPQAAQGQPQPGAAPQGQGGPLQGRIAQLAQMFGRQGQGPQGGGY